jgi:hypothetical protein
VEIILNSKIFIGAKEIINSKIINKGEIDFLVYYGSGQNHPILTRDFYNEGKTSSTFNMKADLYNSSTGDISGQVNLFKNINGTSKKIINEGIISLPIKIYEDDFGFVPNQDFNFSLYPYYNQKNLILSSDTEFKEDISSFTFISKNNQEINIKVRKKAQGIEGDNNINLIIQSDSSQTLTFKDNISNFKTITVLENSKLLINYSNDINSKLINKGEIEFSAYS